MNCLNKLLVDVRARAGAETYVGVALRLAGRGAEVLKSVLEELELLEWVDLLEFSLIRLWATLWVAVLCRGPRRRDNGAIIQRIE